MKSEPNGHFKGDQVQVASKAKIPASWFLDGAEEQVETFKGVTIMLNSLNEGVCSQAKVCFDSKGA